MRTFDGFVKEHDLMVTHDKYMHPKPKKGLKKGNTSKHGSNYTQSHKKNRK